MLARDGLLGDLLEADLSNSNAFHGMVSNEDSGKTEMLNFSLKNPESGWAFASLSNRSNELMITEPYSPRDVLRDLVDSVQSLQTTENAECCWFQEPGELHWNLRRSGKDIEVEILEFRESNFPGQHLGDGLPVFKSRTKWITFVRQLLSSLESIKTSMGCEHYERAWRHPFPTEVFEKLRIAIQRESSSLNSR